MALESLVDSDRETSRLHARAAQRFGWREAGPRPLPRSDSALVPSRLEAFVFGRMRRVRAPLCPACEGPPPTPGRPPWPCNLPRPCVVDRQGRSRQSQGKEMSPFFERRKICIFFAGPREPTPSSYGHISGPKVQSLLEFKFRIGREHELIRKVFG
jgi:hypothetical protein